MRKIAWLCLCCLLAWLSAVPVLAFDPWPPAGAGGPTDLRAYVRFVNLMPGSPPVDVFLDSTREVQCLPYGSATDYEAIMQKSYELTLRFAGMPRGFLPAGEFDVQFLSQFYYTVGILGTPECPRLVVLDDDPTLPKCGSARVRYLNAALGVPATGLALASGAPVFPVMPYGTATGYANLPNGYGPFTVISTANEYTMKSVPAVPTSPRVYTLVVFGDTPRGFPMTTMMLIERE